MKRRFQVSPSHPAVVKNEINGKCDYNRHVIAHTEQEGQNGQGNVSNSQGYEQCNNNSTQK